MFELPAVAQSARSKPGAVFVWQPYKALIDSHSVSAQWKFDHFGKTFAVNTLNRDVVGSAMDGDVDVGLVTDRDVATYGFILEDALIPEAALLLHQVRTGDVHLVYNNVETFLTDSHRGACWRSVLIILFREGLLLMNAVDEGHVFAMSDFRPALFNIGVLFHMVYGTEPSLKPPPILVCSASAPPTIASVLMKGALSCNGYLVVRKPLWRSGLRIAITFHDKQGANVATAALHGVTVGLQSLALRGVGLSECTEQGMLTKLSIIFVHCRKHVEKVVEALNQSQLGSAVGYHSGMPEQTKAANLTLWKNGGAFHIVATSCLIHGVDVPNVCLVVWAQLPIDPLHYYQGNGRGARGDSAFALCILVFSCSLLTSLPAVTNLTSGTHGVVSMLRLVAGRGCRWAALLPIIGDTYGVPDGCSSNCECDICSPDATTDVYDVKCGGGGMVDVSEAARFLVDYVLDSTWNSAASAAPFGAAWKALLGEVKSNGYHLDYGLEVVTFARITLMELMQSGSLLVTGVPFVASVKPGMSEEDVDVDTREYLGLSVSSDNGIDAHNPEAQRILAGHSVISVVYTGCVSSGGGAAATGV